MKDKLIVISGPTASGKTGLAIELAKALNGEIVSADSMQLYKLMDIGTAKPTVEELAEAKHYLIDEIMPDEEMSIATFKDIAMGYVKKIIDSGKIPIICGGTGFYTNALIYNTEFTEAELDEEYRKSLYELAEEKGNEFVHSLLKEVDELSAELIHFNNIKRVIRALEYYRVTGEKISEHNQEQKAKESFFDTKQIILNVDREKLYAKINYRVDLMVEQGLFDEVEKLMKLGYSKDLTSMQGIGYKEIIAYFEGEISKEEAIELVKMNSRRYAKKQVTWFTHQVENGIYVNVEDFANATEMANKIVEDYLW